MSRLVRCIYYRFLWVTGFPLLEFDMNEKRWASLHHPFTSPVPEDLPLLDTDPGKARARAYDLVLNGTELGGGSIRIHDSALQARIFKLLSITDEEARKRFGFFLDALQAGTKQSPVRCYRTFLSFSRNSFRNEQLLA